MSTFHSRRRRRAALEDRVCWKERGGGNEDVPFGNQPLVLDARGFQPRKRRHNVQGHFFKGDDRVWRITKMR